MDDNKAIKDNDIVSLNVICTGCNILKFLSYLDEISWNRWDLCVAHTHTQTHTDTHTHNDIWFTDLIMILGLVALLVFVGHRHYIFSLLSPWIPCGSSHEHIWRNNTMYNSKFIISFYSNNFCSNTSWELPIKEAMSMWMQHKVNVAIGKLNTQWNEL